MKKTVAELRRMAWRGGQATKEKMAHDPDYYHRIAKLGGHAKLGKKHKPKVAKPVRESPSIDVDAALKDLES